MSVTEPITFHALSGSAFEQAEDAFRLVYAEVFAEPPYRETADDVAAAVRRFRSATRKAAFRGVLAYTAGGEPVGMAYGWPLSASTGWWDHMVVPASPQMRRENGRRTFGLMEMAVRAPWRRRGIARHLHENLASGGPEKRTILNVHPENAAAQAAYRRWGYHKVGETQPWPGAELHDVLLIDQRG